MRIEVLTWEEIQALPEWKDDGIYTIGSYWDLAKDRGFTRLRPDRIVELLNDEPDEDGDYESADYSYPSCVIKRFIPDASNYGTHRILKRNPHGIPI